MRINAHGHLLPTPKEIPSFMKEKKLFWIDDDRKFMRQGNWKRPVTDPSFFLEEKLEWMKRNHIDHEVVITLSQLYANGLSRGMTHDIIRFQNDFHAKIQTENPSKFTCGFVVQPRYIDQALEEIQRAKSLGLGVLCLPTHFMDENEKWQTSVHESTIPIWELADELGLSIEIHPYDAPKMIALEDRSWRFHLVWMCAQTADHFHFYTLQDFPNRYPNTRVCFAHGNQFAMMNLGRRQQGYDGRPDLFEGTVSPKNNYRNTNVFFDTLVHDVDSFELLVKRQGVSQIVAGLDDPYPLGEMESVPDCYPGKVIDEAVRSKIIMPEDKDEIWESNVLKWLGRERI